MAQTWETLDEAVEEQAALNKERKLAARAKVDAAEPAAVETRQDKPR